MTDTTKVVYVGPFEAVDIEHQNGEPWTGTAYRGTPIDVPAHVAAGLLEQTSNWQTPAPTKKTTTSPVTDPEPASDERSDEQ